MSSENQPVDSLQDVRDIRKMMERSSRFSSLSGLSCVAAGVCALIGAWLAHDLITGYYGEDLVEWEYSDSSFGMLRLQLLLIAGGTFAAALLGAFFFYVEESKKPG